MTTEPADLDRIAAWMRERGAAPMPPDLLVRAHDQALARRSLRDRFGLSLRPALGWAAGAMAVVALLVALNVLRPTPPPPMVGSAEPPLVPLILVTLHPGTLELVPGDPLTGRPVPGAVPIQAGHHHLTALSPDGRTLALLSWPNDDIGPGRLSLIDLATWTETPTDITIAPTADVPTWSADSRQLLWLQATHAAGQYSIPRGFQLMRWTVGDVAAAPSAILPDDRMPRSARVVGSDLFVYGQPVDTDHLATDVPHLLRIDLATGTITADRRLPDVVAGQWREIVTSGTTDPIENPAVTWDLGHGRLLVASTEQLTSVELSGDLPVVSHTITERRSWLESVLAAITPAASTKSPPTGLDLRGSLAPTGDRLYLTGSFTVRTDGGLEQHPVGLLVVDPGDGGLLEHLDAPFDRSMLSADGSRLLLGGQVITWTANESQQPTAAPMDLVLLDTDGLREVARLAPSTDDTYRFLAGTSWDGRLGYVLESTPREQGAYGTLVIVDLLDGSTTQTTDPALWNVLTPGV